MVEQCRAGGAVSDLAAREHESERATSSVGQRVDLRRPPAARSSDGLIFLPPSSSRQAMRFHSGTVDQDLFGWAVRLCVSVEQTRLQSFPPIGRNGSSGPHLGGASTLAGHLTSTHVRCWRRSSTRGLPRVSVAKCGPNLRKLRFRRTASLGISLEVWPAFRGYDLHPDRSVRMQKHTQSRVIVQAIFKCPFPTHPSHRWPNLAWCTRCCPLDSKAVSLCAPP